MKQSNDFTPSDLNIYLQKYGCNAFDPLEKKTIKDIEDKVGKLPPDLKALYELSNGLEGDGFRIIPIFNPLNPKTTWDSLERANSPATTKFSLDRELLDRFLVFAEIGALHCGMYDREDFSIWYEDDEGYHRTDLNLKGFIELNLMSS